MPALYVPLVFTYARSVRAHTLIAFFVLTKCVLFYSMYSILCKRRPGKSSKNTYEQKIVKSLKQKQVFYLKADKRNRIIILDQHGYYKRVEKPIKENSVNVVIKIIFVN